MTPTELLNKINALQEEINLLKAQATIPYAVEQAFRARLRIDDFTPLSASAKTAASETQAVSEGGTEAYSVATPMDGFFQLNDSGTTRYIPFYN